jgi:hypothetical protein
MEKKIKNENFVTIVVSADEVEMRSCRGYRLVEVVYSDGIEHCLETTTDNENGYNNQYGQRTHEVSKPTVIRRPLFVMMLHADDAVAAKQLEIERLEAIIEEERAIVRESEKNAVTEAQHVKDLERSVERLSQGLTNRDKDLGSLRDLNRKFETDMGKMRTALGDLRMKEILGS